MRRLHRATRSPRLTRAKATIARGAAAARLACACACACASPRLAAARPRRASLPAPTRVRTGSQKLPARTADGSNFNHRCCGSCKDSQGQRLTLNSAQTPKIAELTTEQPVGWPGLKLVSPQGPHPGERGAERAERERAHGGQPPSPHRCVRVEKLTSPCDILVLGRPRHDRQQQRRHLRAWRLRGRGLPLHPRSHRDHTRSPEITRDQAGLASSRPTAASTTSTRRCCCGGTRSRSAGSLLPRRTSRLETTRDCPR